MDRAHVDRKTITYTCLVQRLSGVLAVIWLCDATAALALTPTPSATPVSMTCPGDCNRNGIVTVDEAVTALNVHFGLLPLEECAAADHRLVNGDIEFEEVYGTVVAAAYECPAPPTEAFPPMPGMAALEIGRLSAEPFTEVDVPVIFHSGGQSVASTQNYIVPSDGLFIPAAANGQPRCRINPELEGESGKSALFEFAPRGCSGDSCTAVIGIVFGFYNTDPLPDGVTLFSCTVGVSPSTDFGPHVLALRGAAASDPGGNALPIAGVDGAIDVGQPCTPLPPYDLQLLSLRIDPPRPRVGENVTLGFSVSARGGLPSYTLTLGERLLEGSYGPIAHSVAFPDAVTFDLLATRAGRTTGTLHVNYETSVGCAERPIYQFVSQSSQPFSVVVDPAVTPGVPNIAIGFVGGPPDSVVSLPVTLYTAGQSVASFQNDILFDSSARIRAKPDSPAKPDCEVHPGINKEASSFTFLPQGCHPEGTCTGVRALILSTQSDDTILDGTVAYVCRLHVAQGAAPDGHPLLCSATNDAATPDHVMLHPQCSDGAVRISSTPLCVGDCEEFGEVTISSLYTMINIALGYQWVGGCRLGDRNGDGVITIDEIIEGIDNALNGCSPPALPEQIPESLGRNS